MKSTLVSLADRLAARDPQRAVARARRLQRQGQLHRAFKLHAAAAQAGLAAAQCALGGHYLRGEGVLPNAVEAGRWFSRAARQGEVSAQLHLAGLHLFGLSRALLGGAGLFAEAAKPEADYDAALTWARQAAAAGNAEAQIMAGYICMIRPAPARDLAEAKSWFTAASLQDAPQAGLGLGIIGLQEAETQAARLAVAGQIRRAAEAGLPAGHYYLGMVLEQGFGLPADEAAAAAHYAIAAKAGIPAAQSRYGRILLAGTGVPANAAEAETWLRRAGLAGDAQACMAVATIYSGGAELPPNPAEASLWLRRAAEAGSGEAAGALGMNHLSGNGVPKDAAEAAFWFRRGAEAGDAVSAFNYAVCLTEGNGVAQDEAAAAIWLLQAAEKLLNAQFWYGRALAEGRGVDPDPAAARVWLQKCADAGLKEAADWLQANQPLAAPAPD